jgi:hypothetical protein
MKKIILSILLVMAAFSLQSCLHDDQNDFDQSAAERLDQAALSDKTLLESASNGWILRYYAGQNYQYGGYTYLVKFKDGKAFVSGEIAPDTMVSSSSYDVIKDQGPVLTFNTYNEIMHFLAQPYSDQVDGLQGDYEFVIQKTTQDSVFLKGKKWGNHMVLIRLPEETSWKTYLDSIADIDKNMMYSFVAKDAGDSIGKVNMDGDNRQFTSLSGGDDENVAYYVSTTGIDLQTPVKLHGKSVQHFVFNENDMTLSCIDPGASGIVLNAVLPEGYQKFDAFAGTYKFNYYYGAINVTLTPNADGSSYTMIGLSPNIKPVLKYNKSKGTLSLLTQKVGEYSGLNVYLCAFDAYSGYFTWDTSTGMDLKLDTSESGTVYDFVDNGLFSGYEVNSFILWAFDGAPSSSTSAGGLDGIPDWNINGDYQVPLLQTLVKIK